METEKHEIENKYYKIQARPWLKEYLWKPGQSGNPKGRPKGKTLKEWARMFLEELPDDEKLKFLKEIAPKDVWEMAEGKPQQDMTTGGEKFPTPILYVLHHESGKEDIEAPKED